MLGHVEHLVQAGFAIHWLHPKSKRPIGNDWSEKPVHTLASLKKSYRDGNNVGVRLGQYSKVDGEYLHVIDLDIRSAEHEAEALECLTELFPLWSSYPAVISGSGGASRHFYILCPKQFHSTKLAHSDGFASVFDKVQGREVKKRDWEIELYGTGKQVAMPPSIHPDTGKPYRWLKPFDLDDLDLGLGPTVSADHLAELIGDDKGAASDVDPDLQKPLGLTVEDAEELLSKLPNEHLDYDDWLNVMASMQHESSGRPKEERLRFYEAFRKWSAQSSKHDDRTTKYKFFSFKNKSQRRHRTMRSVQTKVRELELDAEIDNLDDIDVFSDIDDEPTVSSDIDDLLDDTPAPLKKVSKRKQKLNKAEVDAALGVDAPAKIKRLNRKHAVAFVKGKTIILTEDYKGDIDYSAPHEIHNWYENDRVDTDKATEPVSKFWMRHKMRRQYPNGVVFSPGREIEGAFNHWRGWSVEPSDEGSCELLLKHIRFLCDGNKGAYDYFIGWLAHLVQKTDEKPGVAVVLRGDKGAGKDTVFDYVGSLFPRNHIKVSNQLHMTGRFNAHHEKCLLLHVEEGFWAGDKGADGVLKSMITSPIALVERKNIDPIMVDSYLRLGMSSNEDWVIPATPGERRYFVMDVPSDYSMGGAVSRSERKRYFDAIRHERENGGKAALLHYLMDYDLSDFDVADVPETGGLAKQKAEGLKNIHKWWYGMLQTGELKFEAVSLTTGKEGRWDREFLRVERDDFRQAYEDWMRLKRYEGEILSDAAVGKILRKLIPEVREIRKREGAARVRFYAFPPLPNCRDSFESYIGSILDWEENQPIVVELDDIEDDFD